MQYAFGSLHVVVVMLFAECLKEAKGAGDCARQRRHTCPVISGALWAACRSTSCVLGQPAAGLRRVHAARGVPSRAACAPAHRWVVCWSGGGGTGPTTTRAMRDRTSR
jgi:hypothetical protein